MPDLVGRIIGTKRWVYVAFGNVPPGVPDENIPAVIHSSVSWAGTMLTSLEGTTVEVTGDNPDAIMRRLGLKK